jgi:hypothetical protein
MKDSRVVGRRKTIAAVTEKKHRTDAPFIGSKVQSQVYHRMRNVSRGRVAEVVKRGTAVFSRLRKEVGCLFPYGIQGLGLELGNVNFWIQAEVYNHSCAVIVVKRLIEA